MEPTLLKASFILLAGTALGLLYLSSKIKIGKQQRIKIEDHRVNLDSRDK